MISYITFDRLFGNNSNYNLLDIIIKYIHITKLYLI